MQSGTCAGSECARSRGDRVGNLCLQQVKSKRPAHSEREKDKRCILCCAHPPLKEPKLCGGDKRGATVTQCEPPGG
eukprot:COSAG02_NODE_1923_length_10327_cov_6.211501_13_plen_76_part_00